MSIVWKYVRLFSKNLLPWEKKISGKLIRTQHNNNDRERKHSGNNCNKYPLLYARVLFFHINARIKRMSLMSLKHLSAQETTSKDIKRKKKKRIEINEIKYRQNFKIIVTKAGFSKTAIKLINLRKGT